MKQLLSSGHLLLKLASILRRLLPVSTTCNRPKYLQCAYDVAQALRSILVPFTTKATPHSLRSTLAKQLQQAQLVEPLTEATTKLAVTINKASADIYSVSSCADASLSSGPGNDACGLQGGRLESEAIIELSKELLKLVLQISSLWPGSVHDSSKTRALLPAAADLIVALAQLSGKLYKANPADCHAADKMMGLAIIEAHKLMTLHREAVMHLTAADKSAVSSHGSWTLRKTAQFRQLQLLLFAAQAQLWLQLADCTVQQHSLQHQQASAVQQLWVALGYMPDQLATATVMLKFCMRDYDINSAGPLNTYSPQELMEELSISWRFLAVHNPSAALADQQLTWQLVQQEAEQALLVLRIALDLFHKGPNDIQADICYLMAAASWFHQYILSASKMYVYLTQKQAPPPVVLPMSDMVKLLLQYPQHGKAAAQQQQQQASAARGSNGSINGSVRQLEHLQHTVLSALNDMSGHNAASNEDPRLQEVWLTWSCHVTKAFEESLRYTVAAAVNDDFTLWSLQKLLEPSVHAWLRMVTTCEAEDKVLQLVDYDHDHQHVDGSRGIQAAAAGSADNDQCDKIIWEAMAALGSSNAAAAAACTSSRPSSAGCGLGSEAGLESRCMQDASEAGLESRRTQDASSQYTPTSMELLVLSLMTSFCKSMMRTVQIGMAPVQVTRTQMRADYLALRAAGVMKHQARREQQSLLLPAVRPWMSLLGRCLVMMGQRLKVLQQETADTTVSHFVAYLSIMQQELTDMQTSRETTALEQQVTLLKQTEKRYSDDAKKFRRQLAGTQRGSQNITLSQKQEFASLLDKLREASKSKDAASAKLQAAEDSQQQLQQLISQTKVNLCLCDHRSTRTSLMITADLKHAVTSLIGIGKVLSQCWSEPAQQQPQQMPKNTRAPESDVSKTATASSLHARLSPIMQQLLLKLLPTLVIVEGVCSLLPDDRPGVYAPKLAMDAGCSAINALTKGFQQAVLDGVGIKWLEDHKNDAAVEGAFQAETSHSATAELMRELLGKHVARKKLNAQRMEQLQKGLLSSKLYQQLHEQLVVIGSELVTALPHCWCCNNPGCVNLSADSELQLISGKQRVCGGCTGGSTAKDINSTAARYCSVECQKQHWKQHRRVCRRLHKQ